MAQKPAASRRRAKFKEPITVPLHSILPFVKMLQDKDRVTHFVDAAKAQSVTLKLDPDSANFVQQFLKDHDLHSALATAMVDPCPDKPFCNS